MVTLKASHTVKPAAPTPNGRTYLSPSDHVPPITHAPTIYFYRPTISFTFSCAVENLKTSLSQVLVHFYPLAGRLQWANGGGGRVELDCNAMGAQLIEAETDSSIDDFGDFCPTPELGKLVPLVDYSAPIEQLPLLLVQLTQLSCGGISLGMAISHVIVDGKSALHFFAEWTRFARGEPLDLIPFHDRTLLKPRDPPVISFDHVEYSPAPLLVGQPDDLEERNKETSAATLHLSKTQVETLKAMANEGRASHARAYSRYEAIAAHLWRSACKARGHKDEQFTNLRMIVSIRDRMQPPLPQGYFGNSVMPTLRASQAGKLLSEPLSYAASRIREAVECITSDYARSSLDYLSGQPDLNKFRRFHTVGCTQAAFGGNPNLDVISWLTIPLYGADFGWGKEIYVGPGAIGYDGKCFILPSHSEDGSVIIVLRFQVAHLEALKKFFHEDIPSVRED